MNRKSLFISSALAVGVVVLAAIATTAQRQQPTVEQHVIVDRAAPPETAAELGDVDLVVEVRIVSAAPRNRGIGDGYTTPETKYVALVLESGRTRRQLPIDRRIEILRPGGDFHEAEQTRRVMEEGNPPLEVGETYVLTLRWNELVSAYVLPFGADSVFEVINGRIEPRGRGPAAMQFKGRRPAEVLSRIQ